MTESNFQFKDPVLEQINFNVNPDFHTDNTNVEMKNTFKMQVIKSKDENAAVVKLEIYINIDKEDTPFRVQAIVSSKFTWEGLDSDVADKMLHTNAPALLLSYARPIIANLTSSSPFPTYHLPFMNFNR